MAEIEKKLRKDVLLKRYTTFKIGGEADYFISVKSTKALSEVIKYANENKKNYFVIGDGSNLLVNDKGFRGIIIRNSIKGINKIGKTVIIKAGEEFTRLVDFATENSLTGAEFAAGIPGTIGGAIYGNAGAYGRSVSDILKSAVIMDEYGNTKKVDRDFFKFDYRWSNLKREYSIVIEAEFELEEAKKEDVAEKVKSILKEREGKHPPYPWMCAGSYFKNLPPDTTEGRRIAAGMILDKCGAKGMKYGGAEVYVCHANFVMNGGNAKAEDVIELAKILKRKAKENFGVSLEEEVMYLGENGISFER